MTWRDAAHERFVAHQFDNDHPRKQFFRITVSDIRTCVLALV
jgi:hypothetical protein